MYYVYVFTLDVYCGVSETICVYVDFKSSNLEQPVSRAVDSVNSLL